MDNLMKLKEQIEEYKAYNEQERRDKEEMLRHICESEHILTRDNKKRSFYRVGMDRKS